MLDFQSSINYISIIRLERIVESGQVFEDLDFSTCPLLPNWTCCKMDNIRKVFIIFGTNICYSKIKSFLAVHRTSCGMKRGRPLSNLPNLFPRSSPARGARNRSWIWVPVCIVNIDTESLDDIVHFESYL